MPIEEAKKILEDYTQNVTHCGPESFAIATLLEYVRKLEKEQAPNIDELRVEITALQNRCYALTKGVMCGFCNYECQYKVDRSME